MTGVSCPSASQCVVAGHYGGTSGDTQGLLLTGSGSSWTATRAPVPSNADGSGYVYVMGVSCSSASRFPHGNDLLKSAPERAPWQWAARCAHPALQNLPC